MSRGAGGFGPPAFLLAEELRQEERGKLLYHCPLTVQSCRRKYRNIPTIIVIDES